MRRRCSAGCSAWAQARSSAWRPSSSPLWLGSSSLSWNSQARRMCVLGAGSERKGAKLASGERPVFPFLAETHQGARLPGQPPRVAHSFIDLLSLTIVGGRHRASTMLAIRIIGIDPGLRRTGWGIIRVRRGAARLCSLRLGMLRRWGGARGSPPAIVRRPFRGACAPFAGRSRDRADLRQPRRFRHAEARSGARHRHAGAGALAASQSPNMRRTPSRKPWSAPVTATRAKSGQWWRGSFRAPRRIAPMPPTRSPSPSPMRIAATWRRLEACGRARRQGACHDRQAHRAPRRGRSRRR